MIILNISDNELGSVPEEIIDLTNLEQLLTGGNPELVEIPHDMLPLKSLKKLSLSAAVKSNKEVLDQLKIDLPNCKIW